MLKNCTKCNLDKPLSRFSVYKCKGREGKVHAQCKDCYNRSRSEFRANNPGVWKEIEKKARYKYKYGLAVDKVKTFGQCPICNREAKLVCDHNHDTGKFRDFICYNCNTLLGHIENQDKMNRVNSYLKVHSDAHIR